uniref:Uncharacterized protein n=1 Tax=viral metagenome TaxID=1070528 RepID=A0A6H1ZJ96_9ZZZZ
MYFLVYQKGSHNFRDEPDLICHSFESRVDLCKWALDNGIRLYPRETVLILNGETGEQERGTNDIRSEIARLEAGVEV